MKRVAVLYDGFNFYYGLRKLRIQTGVCLYWLDLKKLSECIMEARPGHDASDRLSHVVYFTAHIRGFSQDKHWRQKNYLDLLKDYSGIQVVRGEYQVKPTRCMRCDTEPAVCNTCNQPMTSFREKQTDVNLALWTLTGAFKDAYDDVVIVTSDSDLAPAANYVRRDKEKRWKRSFFAFPPEQVKNKLLIDKSDGWCMITETMLQTCLLRKVVRNDQRRFSCPIEWMEGGAVH